ncbi:annexin A7 11 [Nesidiocoris tenuis]|uniref:Annexin n=1 Tax=Nesidiocoris tenuis TaxID=355587 RepID=A0ABN7B2W5_9HEMI|nr:annexin A7 11 [Nesidiocoris tenuis]
MSYPGYPAYPPQGQPGHPNAQPSAPAYQTAPLSYPIYPGSTAPQPHPYPYPPAQNAAPYPNSSPYPSPYPGANPSPYPGANPSPYPSSNPSPYPSSNPSPYPTSTQSPYPGSTQSSYPTSVSVYPQAGGSYPGGPAPQPTYPGSQPSPYPTQQPYPGSQGSSPYPSKQTAYPTSSGPHSNMGHQSPSQYSQYGNKPPQPTLRPANPFNPREDAEILRKAMKGFGTDEKAIIQVLCNRTNAQRQQIAAEFKTLYGKDLISDLKSETSGNFERALVAMMTPLPEYLAKQIKKAIDGIGTVEETLVEILCTASNYEIKCITAAYMRLFGKSLESELASDTSGNFKRLLVSICQANRSEIFQVDQHAAVQDAQALLRAGELRLGTDESTFNAILCSRSYPQLNHIFVEYQRLTGNDFETAIRNEFSGDVQEGLLAIVKSTTNKSRFFAEEIHKSMKGAGTDDEALIRLIVSRSEIDLGNVKEAYGQLYGRQIQEDVADETSGDYKKALLALLVGNVH